jgi:hypothetical protein
MLKYSITALALVAGSTFALADPQPGSKAAGESSSGAAMEHSGGGMQGESKGSAKAKGDGGQTKENRSSTMGGPNSSRENSASRSNEGNAHSDRQRAQGDQGNAKANTREAQDNDRNMKNGDRAGRNDKNDRNERVGADQSRDHSKANRASTGASEGAEGKGSPKGSVANISTEQKTRVRSVFASHRVAPARDINVSVNVGVRVPRSVHFYPIPEDIVTIVPDYSGYEYFMIDESHVAIVDPDTLEVVDIIVVA